MTDQEITGLYRSLLGRDPEDPGTMAAFRAYYPTLERGRRAILNSAEFAAYFARITGRTLQGRDPVAGALALDLLARAAAIFPPQAADPPRDPDLRTGMAQFFPPRPAPRLALVVGEPGPIALPDLLPFGPDSAILHIAPGFPPVVPLTARLDESTLFRLGADPASAADLLRKFGRKLDAVCLLGPPATRAWVDATRSLYAEQNLTLIGPASEKFDAVALSAAIAGAHRGEPVQHWRGLHLHHIGGWLLPVTYEPPAAPPRAPDRAAYPSLAIAAIVRNEAGCIENMLRSARPVASFFAILDTGSDDDTPALARATLAGMGTPFALAQRDHTEFADHFGNMRNAALAMVPETIDWVLMLDADEELSPEDFTPLLQLIATGTDDAYALPRYNFPGADKSGKMLLYPDRQTRLIRHNRKPPVTYINPVHEITQTPAGHPPLDQSAIGGPRGGPHIHHLVRRFRTPEQEERKQAFYREIARRKT